MTEIIKKRQSAIASFFVSVTMEAETEHAVRRLLKDVREKEETASGRNGQRETDGIFKSCHAFGGALHLCGTGGDHYREL